MKSTAFHTISGAVVALTLIAAGRANAQDITTEIDVNRTVQPVERPATRPAGLLPVLNLPQVKLKPLELHEYLQPSELTLYTPLLEPVAYGDTITPWPYRGYAGIGYFPSFNLGASAGYRFVKNATMDAGAWLQYNGASYKGYGDMADNTYRRHAFSVGADLSRRFGAGILRADVGYRWSNRSLYDDNTHNLSAAIDWQGRAKTLDYFANIAFDHFNFTHGTLFHDPADAYTDLPGAAINPVYLPVANQNRLTVSGGVGQFVKLSIDLLNNRAGLYREYASTVAGQVLNSQPKSWSMVATLTPSYAFKTPALQGRIGLNLNVATGTPTSVFSLAPEVLVVWTPSSRVAVEGRFTGGKQLNTVADLYSLNMWINPTQVFGPSNVPVDARLSIGVGPFAGVTAKLFGGWSMANDWLKYDYINPRWKVTAGDYALLAPGDIKGWQAGIELGYTYDKYLKLTASATAAPQAYDKGYYLWRDHARYVVDARAEIYPIEPLIVTLGYELRGKRRSYFSAIDAYYELGSVSNLSLGANYALTDAFGIALSLDNLLGHRYELQPGIAAQGLTGLVGVTLKF